MSDARNSSNNIRGGGSKQTGGKSRTSKTAASGKNASLAGAGDDNLIQQQLEHAAQQQQGKDLARDVLKEVVFDSDFKAMKMELPTAVIAMRRMKENEKRKLFYETEADWMAMLKGEWVAELKGDFESNKKAKELTDAGDVEGAKGEKKLRIAAKAEARRTSEETEEAGGVKRALEEGGESAEEVKRKAAEASKATADSLGLGNISPEVMAAMAAQREAAAAIKAATAAANAAKSKGVCVVCETNPGVNTCSKCLMVQYCGRECQVGHWKSHKKMCKIWAASNNEKK